MESMLFGAAGLAAGGALGYWAAGGFEGDDGEDGAAAARREELEEARLEAESARRERQALAPHPRPHTPPPPHTPPGNPYSAHPTLSHP